MPELPARARQLALPGFVISDWTPAVVLSYSGHMRTIIFIFFASLSLAACGVTLPLTPAAMSLQAAPWTAPPPPDLSEALVTARQSCAHQVEELRDQALAAAKWRDGRRLLVAVGGALASGGGVVMAATSVSTDDAQAIGGYVLAGAGVLANIIDAVVPLKRYEALHAAWQTAYNLLVAADGKLRDLNACTALDSPTLDAKCAALGTALTPLAVAEPPVPSPAELARKKLLSISGLNVIRGIQTAYRVCSVTTPAEY